MSPEQITILSTVVALIFIESLDFNQQNTFGNFVVNVGQLLLTSAAQGQFLQKADKKDKQKPNENCLSQQLDLMKKQIDILEQQINKKN